MLNFNQTIMGFANGFFVIWLRGGLGRGLGKGWGRVGKELWEGGWGGVLGRVGPKGWGGLGFLHLKKPV